MINGTTVTMKHADMRHSRLTRQNVIHLNRPILLRWENISPPPTNSNTMYRLELSYNITHVVLEHRSDMDDGGNCVIPYGMWFPVAVW